MRGLLISLAVFFLLVFIWQVSSCVFQGLDLFVSTPGLVFNYAIENFDRLFFDFFVTVRTAILAFLISILLGGSVALIGLRFRSVGDSVIEFSTVLQTIPLVVFVPFSIAIFGFGVVNQIALATLLAFTPVVIGGIVSLRSVVEQQDEIARLYNFDFLERFRILYFPLVLPKMLGYLRISMSFSVLGAVIAEFVGSSGGIGRNVFIATTRLEPELIVLSVFMCVLLGATIHRLFKYASRQFESY